MFFGLPIGPKESYHAITRRPASFDLDRLIVRRCDLGTPTDRTWLAEQIRNAKGLLFSVEELCSIVNFVSRILEKDWLTVYPGGRLGLRIEEKMLEGLYLFEHLIPLGCGLRMLEGKPGFEILLSKLNRPTYDRLSTLLEAFAAARYAAAGFDVELNPTTPEGKHSDFKVLFRKEWIYFECKRVNVRENQSAKKNLEFAHRLIDVIVKRFRERIPNNSRIEIRLDRRPTSAQTQALLDDLEARIVNDCLKSWVIREFGKYALVPRSAERSQDGYCTSVMQITVGTTPTLLALAQAPVCIFLNPYGSKIEQRFREELRQSRRQIPAGSRGILVIQGLNEDVASRIMQERICCPEYRNIIAGVAIDNGAIAVRRDDHSDVETDFIGKCVSFSLFHGYDVGNY
jgi:hypothetical protein